MVVATAESQRVVNTHGVPFTDTIMQVVRRMHGQISASFTLRQSGQQGVSKQFPVAQPNHTYLLFVKQYERVDKVPGTYVCVGGPAGSYSAVSDGSFVKTDPLSPNLPESLSLDRLDSVLQ